MGPTLTAMPTPSRSFEQRMEALARANAIRTRRARMKVDIKTGAADPGELILEPPDWLETCKLFDVMLAVPKYGRAKVNRIFIRHRISPSKTVGGLSDRQRNEILLYLAR